MSRLSKGQLAKLLSMYVDNELTAEERMSVEKLVEESPEARAHLEDLLRIQHALKRQPLLEPNEQFYEQLHAKLPTYSYVPEDQPIIQKKYIPAAAGISIIAFALIALFAVLNQDAIIQMFSKTSQDVKMAYEENVIKGWIMPLFEKTGKNEALQYAMYGVLPLDDSSNTVIRVNSASDEGYEFELGQGSNAQYENVTLADLYEQIDPTEEQQHALDTILTLASIQIEEGVLMDGDEQLAISPAVIDLQRSLMAKVAASLDAPRRVKFENFLRDRNATYAVRVSSAPAVSRAKLVRQLEEHSENSNTFVMISPDTIVMSELAVDGRMLRKEMQRHLQSQVEYQRQLRINYEKLARRMPRTQQSTPDRNLMVVGERRPVSVSRSESGMRLQIQVKGSSDHQTFVTTYVQRRGSLAGNTHIVRSGNTLTPGVREETVTIDMQMDSIQMVREEAMQQLEKELQRLESNGVVIELNNGTIFLKLDSLDKTLRNSFKEFNPDLPQRQLAPPEQTAPLLPEGIEIRPDYYERERDGKRSDPYIQNISRYKQRLREYKSAIKQYQKQKQK